MNVNSEAKVWFSCNPVLRRSIGPAATIIRPRWILAVQPWPSWERIPNDALLTMETIAIAAYCSERTVLRHVQSGKLKVSWEKMGRGRHTLIRKSVAERWMESVSLQPGRPAERINA